MRIGFRLRANRTGPRCGISVDTPVATRADGILYGRNLSRLVRPGQSFAVVAGDRPLPPPELPVIDT